MKNRQRESNPLVYSTHARTSTDKLDSRVSGNKCKMIRPNLVCRTDVTESLFVSNQLNTVGRRTIWKANRRQVRGCYSFMSRK